MYDVTKQTWGEIEFNVECYHVCVKYHTVSILDQNCYMTFKLSLTETVCNIIRHMKELRTPRDTWRHLRTLCDT